MGHGQTKILFRPGAVGFGGQLVSLLTQQLSGTFKEEVKDRTKIYFEFKTGKAA